MKLTRHHGYIEILLRVIYWFTWFYIVTIVRFFEEHVNGDQYYLCKMAPTLFIKDTYVYAWLNILFFRFLARISLFLITPCSEAFIRFKLRLVYSFLVFLSYRLRAAFQNLFMKV